MSETLTPCQMMLSAPNEARRSCDELPTVGTNGLYRYCDRHMRMCAEAGATTLVWDAQASAISLGAPSPSGYGGAR